MKDKSIAAILALFLGGFGIHRFYLNQPVIGILYLIFCWTFIPAFIGLIDFICFLAMSKNSFDLKYNSNNQNFNAQTPNHNQYAQKAIKSKATFYPKTEDEAYFAILLKIAKNDDELSLDEIRRILISLNQMFSIREDEVMKKYDVRSILNSDLYTIIDKCLDFISDKQTLVGMIGFLCISDGQIDPKEMNIINYISNKSNIGNAELESIIQMVKEEN